MRDSKVSFTIDQEKGQGVLVHAHKAKQTTAPDEKERVQCMQSYGMEDWETWKEYVTPEACLMEHRTGSTYASKQLAIVECCHTLAMSQL